MTIERRYQLDQVQRWMQSVITDPAGVEQALSSEAARAYIDITSDQLEQVVCRSEQLTSVERLQIYANAYFARLLECLREEFPALAYALGEEAFSGFAIGYLRTYPSQSYTLNDLGSHFPQFLAETRPPAEKPDGNPDWADFLVDLATVERLYHEVFDGPGSEGKPTLRAEDISGMAPEEWPNARLVPVPALRLVSLQFPVHDYITAVRQKGEATISAPSATYLVISRRDFVVRRSPVLFDEYQLLKSLVAGATVGEAIEQLASGSNTNLRLLQNKLQRWFRAWGAAGYFQGIR